MCGISIVVSSECSDVSCISEELKSLVEARGPDCSGSHEIAIPHSKWQLAAFGSTLWTQGKAPTSQPIVTKRGSFLLWNGDAYNYQTHTKLSDSHSVLEDVEGNRNPLEVLSKLLGPYAFIYYDPGSRSLWFGRDPIGRCSLLFHSSENTLVVSSVLPRNLECFEIPSLGIFRISFTADAYELHFHPWVDTANVDVPDCLPHFSAGETIQHNVLDRRKCCIDVGPDLEEIYRSHNRNDITPLELLESLLAREKARSNSDSVLHFLAESVRLRVSTKPQRCLNCSDLAAGDCQHSKVAILFSGGLDSTILAVLAHRVLDQAESIDLFNVAFEKTNSKAADAPDRVTGLVALDELRRIAPERKWNWVEISIDEKELNEKLDHIADLIHPLTSVLDESLGCALWFAARGEGILESRYYRSPARVVLVGMGADELFGGYSRHAKAFQQTGSWEELDSMLLTEVKNIGSRNLGRDNRVVSDHGRMMRAPFLDEAFVSFVNRLPTWMRCCPSKDLPRGVGDKTLLRLVALAIGLRETAVQPKRALQFGSRIANSKQKGHQTSIKLTGPL